MKFHAKDPKFQDITANYHPAGMQHIRRHDARPRFSYSPRSAQRGRAATKKENPNFTTKDVVRQAHHPEQRRRTKSTKFKTNNYPNPS